MTNPVEFEVLPPSGDATRLPSLGTPELSTAYLAKMKEIIEVLVGRRSSAQWDRAVTFRDLFGDGGTSFGGQNVGGDAFGLRQSPLVYGNLLDRLENSLRNSKVFTDLNRIIGSVEDLATFPEEIRSSISAKLTALAKERQADILRTDQKLQTSLISMASQLTELTASFETQDAGVREFSASFADRTQALATSLLQVAARMDNIDGAASGVTIEEKFLAQASAISGLLGQWSVKIQAGSDDDPIIAGIGLSVEDPIDGPSTSRLVFLADQFAMFTSNGAVSPFSADANGLNINGLLRVNGTALQDIGANAARIELAASSLVFAIAATGGASPPTITVSAVSTNLTGPIVFTITQADGSVATLVGTGSSRQILPGTLNGDSAQITVTQGGKSDILTVVRIYQGTSGITALLTNESHSIPTNSAGTGGIFSGAATSMAIYIGAVNDTANWAFTRTNSDGVTSAITGPNVAVSAMTGDTGYVDITAARAGYASITKRFSLNKARAGGDGKNGNPGMRGATDLAVLTSGNTWSDQEAVAALLANGYGAPQNGDLITLYRADNTFAKSRAYNGNAWVDIGAYINGALLVRGTVLAEAIDARGLSIKDLNGNIILSAGSSLAQQTSSNPNLCPGTQAFNFANGVYGARNGDVRFADGQYIFMPTAPDGRYMGAESPALGIPAGAIYTVSFSVVCNSTVRDLWCDVVTPGGSYDSPGIRVIPDSNQRRYTYTETMANVDNATQALVRFFSGTPGGDPIVVSDIKVELGSKATAWCDSIITGANAASRVMPNSINNTMIGGDLFSTNWNGYVGDSKYGTGWYLARSGDMYINQLHARGALMGGDYYGYAWPAAGGTGYFLGEQGLLLGNPSYNRYFQITSDGNIYAPGFRLENSQLTLTNPVIITPRINTAFGIGLPNIRLTRQNNGSLTTSTGVAIYNGGGAGYSYQWTLSVNGRPESLTLKSNPSADNAVLAASGSNTWVYGYLTVIVTDLASRVAVTTSAEISIQFGTAVEA
jgi:hypothetical protein